MLTERVQISRNTVDEASPEQNGRCREIDGISIAVGSPQAGQNHAEKRAPDCRDSDKDENVLDFRAGKSSRSVVPSCIISPYAVADNDQL